MTNEQIEQDVRDVAGPDASERKVQALVQAVERFGPEWLKNYQQRQQRQPTAVRQYTSRQRSTLDWADVEAWVKRQPQTSENWAVGGYYTTCPVSTHKTDDLISVWSGKDGGLGLKCWGNCTYSAIYEALADAIKSTPKPNLKDRVEEPTAENADLTKQLTATKDDLFAAEDHVQKPQAENSSLEKNLTAAEGQARQEAQKRADVEKQLAAANDERERERAAGVVAETRVPKPQTEQSSLAKSLTAAEGQARQEAQMTNSIGSARFAMLLRPVLRKLQDEKSSLENSLSAVTDRRDQFKRERDSAKGKLSRREKRISDLQEENSRLRKTRSAARFRGFDELAAAIASTKTEPERGGNGRLSSAWHLFNKDEPTYAFVEGVRVLELDLRRALKRKTVLDDDGLQCMLMNAPGEGLISEEQRSQLDGMRRQRNQVLHHRRHQLTMPEARDALNYLKPVIDHLGA